ncbi:MAG: phosphate acyltransferase [Atribacterota bacterium]|nr:phosphate acyltransferase [Atribacterota bacterium]MDD5637870.1 phosphate acyltransferase [Atribacterota bacterium]
MINSFKQLYREITVMGRQRVVIAGGEDLEALKAVKASYDQGFGEAVLVGREEEIDHSLQELGYRDRSFIQEIVSIEKEQDKALAAVEEVKKGGILLKGRIKTATLLKAVLNKESGLRTENHVSNVFIFEDQRETKSRLVLLSDGGVNIKPDLRTMVSIINNAVTVAQKLGMDKPKVALLAAIEDVNPDMEETLQAGILAKMNQRGQIPGCIIDGPLALDNAISEYAAQKKKIESPVAGKADILIVPNIVCGNILGKSIIYYTEFPQGNLVVGARVPIMIPSRADKSESKLNSIALSILCSR